MLDTRFSSFNDVIFENMKWYDPKSWTDEGNYGLSQLKELVTRFEIPLSHTTYDNSKVFSEWKRFRNFVKVSYSNDLINDKITATQIWQKIFQYRRSEYSNLCILAEIVMVHSGSNSSVERAFSMLTAMLNDRRLKMKLSTIESLMIVKINDKIWSAEERGRNHSACC